MERIERYAGLELEWLQPRSGARYFELECGGTPLATLEFRSAFGTLAVADTASGRWSYKRVGFLNPRVTVRRPDGDQDLAIYEPSFWGGGTVTFLDRRRFTWKAHNFWQSRWTFADESGRPVVTLCRGVEGGGLKDLFKTQTTIEAEPACECEGLLPVLMTLGFYLYVLNVNDSAAAAAVIA